MPNRFEPERYQDLFQLPELKECREVFFHACWNLFLHLLQGYDEEISLLFAMGFDGKKARVGHLVFPVTEESIMLVTNIPREGMWWHKHWFVPWESHNFAIKPEYWHVIGIKGFHHNWIKLDYINPLTGIIHLITCEGKTNLFKAYHIRLLSHFLDQKCLNFPFYFLRSLEKMSSQVKKITVNPKGNLYHHSLIKLLILDQLKKRNQSWDTFVFKFLNLHLNIRKLPRHLRNCEPSQSPAV